MELRIETMQGEFIAREFFDSEANNGVEIWNADDNEVLFELVGWEFPDEDDVELWESFKEDIINELEERGL
jgi:hypothetical protein